MYVLAFDRDWTVDVNPHPNREAVPLAWVRHWAHDTEHEVWAIGNQDLVEEADIPGTVESIRQRDGDIDALGTKDEYGYYEWWPEREHRLHILAELFPDADGYIVVDDLDLKHVDGWHHYYAWDFVDAVRNERLTVSPPSGDPTPDGGFTSEEEMQDILVDGYVFELTYREEGELKTFLVTHVEPHRPSMTPLRGPPTFWFDPVGSESQFSVRLPNIVALRPVPYDTLAGSATDAAFAAVTEQLQEDPTAVDGDTLETLLTEVTTESFAVNPDTALSMAMLCLQHREDVSELTVEAMIELLDDCSVETRDQALKALCKEATENPALLEPYVVEVATYVGTESPAQQPATRCVMEVAEAFPEAAVDAVPALEAAANADDTATNSFAVYALSMVAGSYPEAVMPAIGVLVEAIRVEDEMVQTNALAALGKIASNYPDAAEPIVDEVVGLLADDAKRVRNNAVGLLGNLAQEHPAVVIEHADQIAARLDDQNIQARVNAALALQRAGEAVPSAIREQQDHIERALHDASPEVRANACLLVGNAEIPIDVDTLRELKENDLDERVQERASWAIAQLR